MPATNERPAAGDTAKRGAGMAHGCEPRQNSTPPPDRNRSVDPLHTDRRTLPASCLRREEASDGFWQAA